MGRMFFRTVSVHKKHKTRGGEQGGRSDGFRQILKKMNMERDGQTDRQLILTNSEGHIPSLWNVWSSPA